MTGDTNPVGSDENTSLSPTGERTSGQPGSASDSPPSSGPQIVAVMVVSNPGPWFEEALASLAAQDCPNLSVLVVDAASQDDQSARVKSSLPDAYVRRLKTNPGYAATVNRAMRIIEGADYLVLCHDDVALAPDALRWMIDLAESTSAEAVTPKYVDWDNPRSLVSIGGTVDVTGAYLPIVEPGELDQKQHDAMTETFATDGGCLVVRAQVFESLGGFDAAMTQFGETLDFSWRLQVAGGRIKVAPQAVVRHLRATVSARRVSVVQDDDKHEAPIEDLVLRRRHQFRTALKVHRGLQFYLAFATQLIVTAIHCVYGIVGGRREIATASVAAITWNAAHWRSLQRAKHALEAKRKVDGKVLRASYGSSRRRVADLVRDEWQRWRADVAEHDFGRDVSSVTRTFRGVPWLTFALLALVWAIGSRDLLTGPLPNFGQFMGLDGPVESLRRFLAAWPSEPFGDAVAISPAHLLLAVPEFLFLGASGTAQRFLLLATIPFGVWGVSRLVRPLRFGPARLLAAVAYAAIPLGYDALGSARFDALIVYALMPFLFSRILRLDGADPYPGTRGSIHIHLRRLPTEDEDLAPIVAGVEATASTTSNPTAVQSVADQMPVVPASIANGSTADRTDAVGEYSFLLLRRLVPLGLVCAIAAAFAPQIITVTIAIVVALLIGDVLAGVQRRRDDIGRLVLVTAGALLLALTLVFPGFAGGASGWSALWNAPFVSSSPDLSSLLRFQAGSISAPVLVVALLLVAAVPLVMGSEWRFRLAVKMWCTVILLGLLLWLSVNNWLGPFVFDPWVWLSPIAVALCLNVGLALTALHSDAQNWSLLARRLLASAVALGVLLSFVPVLGKSTQGAWGLPPERSGAALSWMNRPPTDPEDPRNGGAFRTLWVGAAEAMPGGARDLNGLPGAITLSGPSTTSMAPPSAGGDGQLAVANAIAAGVQRKTVELGRLLAPYGIRYLVVPTRTGPVGEDGTRALSVPAGLTEALSQQLDLSEVETDSSFAVYENDAWIPVLAVLSDPATLAAHSNAGTGPLAESKAAPLIQQSRSRWSGALPGGELYVSQGSSANWILKVDGRAVASTPAFGWAHTFAVEAPGSAELLYKAPLLVRLGQVLNATLWVVVVVAALHYLPRRKQFA